MSRPENVGGIRDKDIIHWKALCQQLANQPDSTVDRDFRVFLQRHLQNARFVERADGHLFSPFRCARVSAGTARGSDSNTASSRPPKYRSIASSSAFPTGSGSGSSFSTVQNSASDGLAFDGARLELMTELFLDSSLRAVVKCSRTFRALAEIGGLQGGSLVLRPAQSCQQSRAPLADGDLTLPGAVGTVGDDDGVNSGNIDYEGRLSSRAARGHV